MNTTETIPPPAPALGKTNDGGELFCFQLSALFLLEAGVCAGRPGGAGAPPASPPAPLGLYLHIPFCRKRCHFCYFKVYTDKDSAAIRGYIDAALKELALYAAKPIVGGRKAELRLFRRRHAILFVSRSAPTSDRFDEGADSLGGGGGSDVRMRTWHFDQPQIEGDS